jgi:hypothetical protein
VKAEITFDLVMGEDMGFVEGCFRLDGGEWEVFIIAHTRNGSCEPGVWKNLTWESGVRGLNAVVPRTTKLNKTIVLRVLSDALGVTEWSEVRGPDSIMLR